MGFLGGLIIGIFIGSFVTFTVMAILMAGKK